ncbi:MAG: phosphoribosylanthranilate isomerase [Bdellovibrionota bacterium]
MTKIKVCGITTLEDAKLALALGADALGFNFYPKSPRYIAPADAQTIVRMLPKQAWMTGVFVNSSREEVSQIARMVALDTLQFHGDEDVSFIEGWNEWRVMKAIRLGSGHTAEHVAELAKVADYLLVDSYQPGAPGGTGSEVPEPLLSRIASEVDFAKVFLAGGLRPENVESKIRQFRPFAVDVASGVESAPGKKDASLLEQFFKAVKAAR